MRILMYPLKGSRSVTRYNEEKLSRHYEDGSPVARVVMTNFRSEGMSEKQIARQLSANSSSRVKNKVLHFAISMHPEENLSSLGWQHLARKVLDEFELSHHKYVVYQHFDKEHPHVHIVVNRCDETGKATDLGFSNIRCRRLSRELENELELIVAEKQRINELGMRREFVRENSRLVQEAIVPSRKYLQAAVMQARVNKPSEMVYLKRLARRNVSVAARPYESEGSIKYGLSYSIIPGQPLFELPVEQERTANALAPNGLEIAGTEGLSFDEFSSFKIRASNLGPAFQYHTHTLAVKSESRALEFMLVDNPEKKNEIHYRDTRELIVEEKPEVSLLITSLELGLQKGIDLAIERGAKVEEISKEEIRYLDQSYVEYAQHYQQVIELELASGIDIADENERKKKREYELSESLSITEYTRTHNRPPNEKSIEFLRLIVRHEYEAAEDLLKDPSLSIDQKADPRILDAIDLNGYHISDSLNYEMIRATELAEYNYKTFGWFRKSDLELEIDRNTGNLKAALAEADVKLVTEILENSKGKLDLSGLGVDQIALIAFTEAHKPMKDAILEFYKDASMKEQFKCAIRLMDTEYLAWCLELDPKLLDMVNPRSLNFMETEHDRQLVFEAIKEWSLNEHMSEMVEFKQEFDLAIKLGDEAVIKHLVEKEPELLLTISQAQAENLVEDQLLALSIRLALESLEEEKEKQMELTLQSDLFIDRVMEMDRSLSIAKHLPYRREQERGLDRDLGMEL